MKKILYSSLVFAGISVLFGICYYFSFRNALLHYNREAVEQNTKILNEILESSSESERLLQQMLNTDEPVYPVSVTQDTLRENASYFLETYYLQSQTEEREELALPGFMVGIDRKELEAYLKGYMEDLPVNEYLKGLVLINAFHGYCPPSGGQFVGHDVIHDSLKKTENRIILL